MGTTGPVVADLRDITDDSFGGKASGLAELMRLGLPVPPGFAIADAAAVPAAAVMERFSRMRAAGSTPVAVRSSAAGEDGAELSFAGQYETVLGVGTERDLVAAVHRCVASADSGRATHYGSGGAMHVVVQQLVDAAAAGVVFTADPVSGRRDLLVIDAVHGLGESLVDGSGHSDHHVLTAAGASVTSEVGPHPVLAPDQLTAIRTGAQTAAAHWGRPLDLEWAIDRAGTLWWLQARPITTLPGELDEMDTPVSAGHVYTRCNIGEMMPGAFCPLTAAVSGHAIDYAMQMVQVMGGVQRGYEERWPQVGYFYGHMFLNLSEGTALSSGILGNSREQFSMSICGRVVDELEAAPPKPFAQRLRNTVRLSAFTLSVGPAIRRLPAEIDGFPVISGRDPRVVLAQLEAGVALYRRVTLTHVRSSSRAAVAANILEDRLVRAAVRRGASEADGRAEAIRLLAGATDVESVVMVEQLTGVITLLAADPDAAAAFRSAAPADAVESLVAAQSPAGAALREFLARHGHRGYRELCMRDPSWADDPGGLGSMMQIMLRAPAPEREAAAAPGPRRGALRLLARLARGGARGREETKSRMAQVAHRLKRGYRHLGAVLSERGDLPDADLVFFFDRAELARLVDGDTALVPRAEQRRLALPFQAALHFPDVSVGRPEPAPPRAAVAVPADGEIAGRPAGRGVVAGVVRVAHSVVEARELRPGEVLVAPVTDVGWTPYFAVIAALVTDIGSSVSHGAVVAREYGLPCVVNTLVATTALRTGDRVRVDGDRGVVTLISRP
ncbi:PEP/pyruvate-binding domain-containing protein [Nocardia jiangsuensis]|uniref:PEP/pyruvate-binding domain-containing protein n=1 Tax=Nocardia jiangsuensis TaxID=1691563 RepID=A0ABV8DYZ6_9NOCA